MMPTNTPIVLRPYQLEAVDAVYRHLRERDDSPCVVLPTASGKTPVIATMCREAVRQWDGRVLILAHVKELLEQAADKLHTMSPDMWHQIGVYSAGLRSRDTDHPIIVAGIQSAYRRACDLGRFDLILIDEAHMIPPDGEGMYQCFLADARKVNPHVRLIGLTATPYRMTTGMICGPDNLLNHVCYEAGVRELIVQGYLCPLKSKAGKQKVDTSGLHVRGGEFVANEVEQLMDDDALVRTACQEVIEQTADRHSTLMFAAGVSHAQHVQAAIREFGHECGFVCGDTPPGERAATLDRFRAGNLKYLVNVNVLTTGFDAPNIDCVVLLRPTNSPGLYYQCVGRGFRLHPSKVDCLVLDFGGNILRHGPVDDLRLKDRSTGEGAAPAKECPQCNALIHAAYSTCPECGYTFPPPEREKHDRSASTAGILSGETADTEHDVRDTFYSVHTKRNAEPDHPRTMRVEYRVGWQDYISEWVCVEHTGYARTKAEAWWRQRTDLPMPATAEEAVRMAHAGLLAEPTRITVRETKGDKYPRVIGHELGSKPAREPGWDDEEMPPADPRYVMADEEVPF